MFKFLFTLLISISAHAQHEHHEASSSNCDEMMVMDYSMGMCMPLPMKDMPMDMFMFHGNSFFTQTYIEGPRGRDAFTIPNMFMLDVGSSVADQHYINLDIMLTAEKWTYPKEGYPELLQVGEENEDHVPYVDSQHPHSSPFMGVTISDTYSFENGNDHLKFWFSPRGQSTDGPVAFMHRPTGMINPDAPLGHHIGQDAGHITSTVLGFSGRFTNTTIEVSTFNGTEPEPAKVDLPMASPNSYALRLIQQSHESNLFYMISAAYVKEPEGHDATIDHVWKYSASAYHQMTLPNGWNYHTTLIWGLINNYEHVSALNSITYEFWYQKMSMNIWGRFEFLQRTADELLIASPTPDEPRWVKAFTIGYSHEILKFENAQFKLGASVTKNYLPTEFSEAYDGDPLTGKIFLQVSGMKIWELN